MHEPPSRISEILSHLDLSDPVAVGRLFTVVYDDLHLLAGNQLRREQAGHTLQPTGLVHEAYLRLVGGGSIQFAGRAHFFRIAARAMRQVLVDAARHRQASKRGGGLAPFTLDSGMVGEVPAALKFIDLHAAICKLERLDPRLGELVELRFFTGLTLDEASDALGVSRRKAAKDWAAARLWLRRELAEA